MNGIVGIVNKVEQNLNDLVLIRHEADVRDGLDCKIYTVATDMGATEIQDLIDHLLNRGLFIENVTFTTGKIQKAFDNSCNAQRSFPDEG
jgi:hypothetical protein